MAIVIALYTPASFPSIVCTIIMTRVIFQLEPPSRFFSRFKNPWRGQWDMAAQCSALSAQQLGKRSSVYAWSVFLLVAVVDPSHLQLCPLAFQTEKIHRKKPSTYQGPFHLLLITFSTSPPSCQVGPRTPSWKEQTSERRLARTLVSATRICSHGQCFSLPIPSITCLI